MSSLFDSAKFVMSVADIEGLPDSELPEIAFAGRSNAGKSTSINCICRQSRLAFSSKTPGRTQLLNFFELSVKEKSLEKEFQKAIWLIYRDMALLKPRLKPERPGKT